MHSERNYDFHGMPVGIGDPFGVGSETSDPIMLEIAAWVARIAFAKTISKRREASCSKHIHSH